MKRHRVLSLAIILTLMIVASGFAIDKPTIYAIGVTPGADPFWAVVYKGLKAAESVLPIKVEYIGLRAEEANPTGLADKLEIVRAAKPDGLITGFWFVEAQDELCRKMIKEGIPIIGYDQEDVRSNRIPYIGFVGLDIRRAGEVAARATLNKMQIKRAAIGIHWPGASSLELKAEGIIKVLRDRNIPFDKLDITDNPATAVNVLNAYLKKYPETNVLFMTGTIGTHSALQFVKEENLKGKVFISTMDVSEKTLQGLKDGYIIQSLTHQPFGLGFEAVEQMYLYLTYGILPPERTSTGPTLVDKDNLEIIEKQIKEAGGA